jgi:hypothetical protein
MASLTLIQMLQEFSKRRGLPVPVIGVASQDDQTVQLIGLLNEVLEDLTTRYVGQALQKVAVWAQLGTESQGLMSVLAPFGFKWMINETFWDRDQRLPVFGPKDSVEWQTLKATPLTGPYLQYRIQGDELLLNGSITAGHTMAFEYASDWAVQAADLVTFKPFFTVDTDVSVFPTSVLLAGLNWRWRLEKGLKYAETFRDYEGKVADFNGHDGTKPTLNMNGGGCGYQPGIFVPTANWPLP